MIFGTWNIRSLCKVGVIKSEVRELEKYKLNLREYKWLRGKGRDIKQQTTIYFNANGNVNHPQVTGFFVHNRINSAAKRVEFVSDRISFITLKGRWCDTIVVNVYAADDEKDDVIKDSFYEKLEQIFDQFPRYHMNILLGDFKAKVRREGGYF
jgi:hypothetical protein